VQYRYSFFALCLCAHFLALLSAIFYYVKFANKDGKQEKKDQLLEKTSSAKKKDTAAITYQTVSRAVAKEPILKQEIHTLTESIM